MLTCHNFNRNSTSNKYILFLTKERRLHVPSFFIMSFFFLKRLVRLLIPYILWPIFFLILNQYLNAKFNKKFPDTFEDLKQQLLLADKYIFPLWFHFDLIIITFLFFIIIFIFRKHSLFILQLLLLLSYIIQYSKYGFNNFFRKNPYYNVNSIRFIPSSIPFTIVGYILGYYNFLDIIQKHKIKTFVLSYLIYNFIKYSQI